ncbi:hypothetical protein HanXRQr2_Chr07g0307641 [Helianthus annuus]|uniref:Uncharacterized protein n=1 Tax=Helianthus annuus TaxID=4232 RepID=A0A9K3IMN8_HELAN|nr:hypothetical protein HanXRQr2_Chr07g0307641 [Helianthus annuus]
MVPQTERPVLVPKRGTFRIRFVAPTGVHEQPLVIRVTGHSTGLPLRRTLREKHIDAFALIRGLRFLRYGCSFGNSRTGETHVVKATNAFSAASQTNRLSCEDLRRSCTN